MYYKIVKDQMIFSDCKSLYIESENRWVSNPTEEQIFAEGWQVYTPPVVPSTEPTEDEIVSAVKTMLSTSIEDLSDEEALEIAALYPTWASKMGKEVAVGERLWYNEKLWKVIQAHTVQENWTPDTAVSLYVEVSIEEWPAWVQPTGAHDAYMKNDKVTYDNKHWISDIDYNTYTPGIYGWTEVN